MLSICLSHYSNLAYGFGDVIFSRRNYVIVLCIILYFLSYIYFNINLYDLCIIAQLLYERCYGNKHIINKLMCFNANYFILFSSLHYSIYLPHTNSIILLLDISACSFKCVECNNSTSCTSCDYGYAVANEQCVGKEP